MTTMPTADAMSVEALDATSLIEIDGGDWKEEIAKAVLNCILNNWTEFKAGISEGYNTPV